MMHHRDARFLPLACGFLTAALAITATRSGADEPGKRACKCKTAETEMEFTLLPDAHQLLKFLPSGVPVFESNATWTFSAPSPCKDAACDAACKAACAKCGDCPAKVTESEKVVSSSTKCPDCKVAATACRSAGTCQAATNGKTEDNACTAKGCNTHVAAKGCPSSCKVATVATSNCPSKCQACPTAHGAGNIANNCPAKFGVCDAAGPCEDAATGHTYGGCPITDLGPPPEMFEFTFEGDASPVDGKCCPFAHGKCPVLHGIAMDGVRVLAGNVALDPGMLTNGLWGCYTDGANASAADGQRVKKLKRKLGKMRETVAELTRESETQARIAEVQRKALEREHELQRQLATVTAHSQYQQQIANIQASQVKMQQQWMAVMAAQGNIPTTAPAAFPAQLKALAEENAKLRARLAQLEKTKASY